MLLASIIVLGSLYSLLGGGFVVIYRASRVLNFAHAEAVMLAGYFGITVSGLIASPVIGLFAVLCCSFLLGLMIYTLL